MDGDENKTENERVPVTPGPTMTFEELVALSPTTGELRVVQGEIGRASCRERVF